MAMFHIGQRVRILWSRGWPELAGQEGAIVAMSMDGGARGDSEWIVAPDCWGTEWAPRIGACGGLRFAPNSSQLEPITDRNNLVTWESCAWRPSGIGTDHSVNDKSRHTTDEIVEK